MGQPKRVRHSGQDTGSWDWENKLIAGIARGFDTNEREELEAELAQHLLRLKRHAPARVRNWPAFIKTALKNKARNWIRDRQAEQNRIISLSKPVTENVRESVSLEDVLQGVEPDYAHNTAFANL